MPASAAVEIRQIGVTHCSRGAHVRSAVHSWWAPAHVLLAKSHDQAAFTFQSSGHPESIGDIHAIRVNPVSTATLPHVSSSAWRAVTAAAAAPAGEAAATQAAVAVTAPAVALDVEYAHYTTADGRHISVPAWVAVVDQHCTVLLKTFIRHQVEAGATWVGGVTLAACAAAPSLQTVLQQLQGLTAGQLLLGHGLAKDLSALGFDHPHDLRFDTVTHPSFCNQSGNSRNLKQLAKEFLDQDIQIRRQPQQQGKQHHGKLTLQAPQVNLHSQQQQQKQPQQQKQQQQQRLPGASQQAVALSRSGHDPEEDAVVVMRLYQQAIYPSTYDGQVALATAQLLRSMQLKQSGPPHAEEA